MKSLSLVQRAFRSQFKNCKAPSDTAIRNIISNFEKTGSVWSVPPKPKNSSTKREEAKNQIKNMVSEFESFSIRKAASATGVLPTLAYHIPHDDLHLKPYKFHQWCKLECNDYEKRLPFATWFLKQPEQTIEYLICSDEAYFSLTLPLNHENNRIWSELHSCFDL